LYVAGQRIKIFLALSPPAVHLDTPLGSRTLAFRSARTEDTFQQNHHAFGWHALDFRPANKKSCQNQEGF
jgi:hypothetical protein